MQITPFVASFSLVYLQLNTCFDLFLILFCSTNTPSTQIPLDREHASLLNAIQHPCKPHALLLPPFFPFSLRQHDLKPFSHHQNPHTSRDSLAFFLPIRLDLRSDASQIAQLAQRKRLVDDFQRFAQRSLHRIENPVGRAEFQARRQRVELRDERRPRGCDEDGAFGCVLEEMKGGCGERKNDRVDFPAVCGEDGGN